MRNVFPILFGSHFAMQVPNVFYLQLLFLSKPSKFVLSILQKMAHSQLDCTPFCFSYASIFSQHIQTVPGHAHQIGVFADRKMIRQIQLEFPLR